MKSSHTGLRRLLEFSPNLGALDGKHVAIKCPEDSGSIFYNYQCFYSIVLIALVDAKYRFVWIDVGYETSDAQLFNSCELKQRLKSETLGVPLPEPMSNDDEDTPYFFVADETFAMTTWPMKPYARRAMAKQERIYNYRLSQAWRLVENAFGILTNRFQCLLIADHSPTNPFNRQDHGIGKLLLLVT